MKNVIALNTFNMMQNVMIVDTLSSLINVHLIKRS